MNELIQLLDRSNLCMGEDGATCEEIALATSMSNSWVRERLRELHREGRLIAGRKTITDISGRRAQVPAYRIRPSEDRLNGGDASPSRDKRRVRSA